MKDLIQTVLPEKILNDVATIGSSKKIKLLLKCCANVVVTETELCSYVRVDAIDLTKLHSDGILQKYVCCYLSTVNRLKYYILNPQYIYENLACDSCSFCSTEGILRMCKSSDVSCSYGYWRRSLNAYLKMKDKLGLVLSNSDPIYRGNKLEKLLYDYKVGDFYSYIRWQYKKCYKDDFITINQVRLCVQNLVQYIRIEYGDAWKSILKQYIDFSFRNATEQSKIINLRSCFYVSTFKRFTDNLTEAKYCSVYKIYCIFSEDNKTCSRYDNVDNCNQELRDKVMERFN